MAETDQVETDQVETDQAETDQAETDQAARSIIELITATWRSRSLYAAVALAIPDLVAGGHTVDSALSAATGVDRDAIHRLMRLLVRLGVFGSNGTGGYRLTPVGELLRAGSPGSLRDLCLVYGEEFHQAWGPIVPALRSGRPGFEHAFGASLHDYLGAQPGAGDRFLRAMNAGGTFFRDVPRAYDFTGACRVTDVGGGGGVLLSTVLTAHPHLHGTLFDRQHMLAAGEQQLRATVDPGRYTTVAGDMFESVPPGADIYLLSRVLQDWDDAASVRLLANCRAAMTTARPALLLIERVIDPDAGTLLPHLWDLQLMMVAGGGERTLDQYSTLLSQAGLRITGVQPLALEARLISAVPEPH